MKIPVQIADASGDESTKPYVHSFSVGWYNSSHKNFKVKFKGKSIDKTITIESLTNYETRQIYLIETTKKTIVDSKQIIEKSVGIITK